MCVCVCVCAHTQSLYPVQLFCRPIDSSPPGSSIHGISQARILKLPSQPASLCAFTAMFPGCLLSGSASPHWVFVCSWLRRGLCVGVGSVGASLGTRRPPGPGLRPLIPPASLLYGHGDGGRLATHLLSGLRVMCCLGSWDGKVRRKGLLFPRPGGFGRLQVDGVLLCWLKDQETQ